MSNPWEISNAEYQSNCVQFVGALPQNGLLSGQNARNVLMKSGLPPAILGQIWNLSDINRDGMLDEREFSIAMRLTRNCIQGLQLPQVLPQSMLNIGPSSLQITTDTATSFNLNSQAAHISSLSQSAMPAYNTAPAGLMQSLLHGTTTTSISQSPLHSQGRQCGNWIIPQQKRLHYCQQFNQLDKQRVGFLSGNTARNAMGQSGLPMPILAHIWNLSDVNKDGRLSVDEFCIASYFIDMSKTGYALPDQTPVELAQMCGVDREQNISPQVEPGAPPPQKVMSPRTFEDKRKDNFDKGQAELERRRQLLREEEERRRAEIEKREREEAEKRQREQMEKERKREEERQRENERLMMLEEARLAEERKREMEREKQRKEQEKIRMAELEKQRIRELQAQKQQEAERTAQRLQRHKTLGFQVQALDEKSADMNSQITLARAQIEDITKDIEGMRAQRDVKVQKISELQSKHQQLSVQHQELAHALLQMQSANRDTSDQLIELEQCQTSRDATRERAEELKLQVAQARERTAAQKAGVQKKQEEMAISRPEFEKVRAEYTTALNILAEIQEKARECVQARDIESARKMEMDRQMAIKQHQAEAASALAAQAVQSAVAQQFPTAEPQIALNTQHPTTQVGAASLPQSSISGTGTAKYRALFDFNGRNDEELTFNEGDIILVFEGHASEPGWLAGQIRDTVGWFPTAFAEPLAPVKPNVSQPIQSASEVTPSPSLDRIIEEETENKTNDQAHSSLISSSASTPVICACIAQFPWKARNDGDLSFSKGDSIEVIEQQEMKWCGRKSDGSIGWFPKSYVKVVAQTSSPKDTVPAQTNTTSVLYDAPPGDFTTSQPKENIPVSDSISSIPMYDAPPVENNAFSAMYDAPPCDLTVSNSDRSLAEASWPAGSNITSGSQPAGEWFVALYDFEAVEVTDLPLQVGDRILVVEQNDQWWKGSVNGREGLFPANYVEKSTGPGYGQSAATFHGTERAVALAEFLSSAPNQLALKQGDVIIIRSKSEQGWWEGETIREGKPVAGWFPGNYVQVEGGSSTPHDVVLAMFEYDASQHDELSFKVGDKIVVTSRGDGDWWTGHKIENPALSGVFPSAYVQVQATTPEDSLSVVKLPQSDPTKAEKLRLLKEELLQTEDRYLSDLILVRKLFHKNLSSVTAMADMHAIVLNWEQLIDLSQRIKVKLQNGMSPGSLFLSEIDGLQEFVKFCSRQQNALDTLSDVTKDPTIRHVYSQCCCSPHARGMSLSSFILLPLGRITRYPLLVEKMLSSSASSDQDTVSLETSLNILRTLVEEINRQISEIDNISMLYWSQQHVKSSLQPPLEYASDTRLMGPRKFIHSGILYKARSGKLLVGLLYNDILILTTPDESIHDAEGFKLSRNTDISFTIYKSPLLTHILTPVKEQEESHFSIKHGEDAIHLRATNGNSCRMWMNQLQQTADLSAITIAERRRNALSTSTQSTMGRLLVEVITVENVDNRIGGMTQVLCRLSLRNQSEDFSVDMSQPEFKITTQFPFDDVGGNFSVSFRQKRLYAPDVLLFDEATISLSDLVQEGSTHRGPIRRTLPLRQGVRSQRKPRENVIVKFVVQIFNAQL